MHLFTICSRVRAQASQRRRVWCGKLLPPSLRCWPHGLICIQNTCNCKSTATHDVGESVRGKTMSEIGPKISQRKTRQGNGRGDMQPVGGKRKKWLTRYDTIGKEIRNQERNHVHEKVFICELCEQEEGQRDRATDR